MRPCASSFELFAVSLIALDGNSNCSTETETLIITSPETETLIITSPETKTLILTCFETETHWYVSFSGLIIISMDNYWYFWCFVISCVVLLLILLMICSISARGRAGFESGGYCGDQWVSWKNECDFQWISCYFDFYLKQFGCVCTRSGRLLSPANTWQGSGFVYIVTLTLAAARTSRCYCWINVIIFTVNKTQSSSS